MTIRKQAFWIYTLSTVGVRDMVTTGMGFMKVEITSGMIIIFPMMYKKLEIPFSTIQRVEVKKRFLYSTIFIHRDKAEQKKILQLRLAPWNLRRILSIFSEQGIPIVNL